MLRAITNFKSHQNLLKYWFTLWRDSLPWMTLYYKNVNSNSNYFRSNFPNRLSPRIRPSVASPTCWPKGYLVAPTRVTKGPKRTYPVPQHYCPLLYQFSCLYPCKCIADPIRFRYLYPYPSRYPFLFQPLVTPSRALRNS